MSFSIMEVFDQAVVFVYQRCHQFLTFRHSSHLTIVLKLVFFLGFWDVHFPDTWWSKNRQVGCWGWNCPQFPQFLPFRKRRAWRPGVLGGGGDSRTYLTKQYGLQLQCQNKLFTFSFYARRPKWWWMPHFTNLAVFWTLFKRNIYIILLTKVDCLAWKMDLVQK